MGLLCVTIAADLMHTPLGRRMCLGLGVFWGIRLVIQFFGYSAKLWRGKVFETFTDVVFTLFWGWLTAVFLIVVLKSGGSGTQDRMGSRGMINPYCLSVWFFSACCTT